MSAINIPVSTPSVVPVPGPNTVAPPSTTIPQSPPSASTLYDMSMQGDVNPSALLPPDFEIQSWGPALYTSAGDSGCGMRDCYANDYTVMPFSPSYYSTQSGRDLDWGDFLVQPMTSYFAKANKAVGFDLTIPVIGLGIGLVALAAYYWNKKR